MKLAVQIDSAAATALLNEPGRRNASDLEKYLRQVGVSLSPMHPGTKDPELRTWFHATVPAAADAQEVAQSLCAHKSILAAYPKPLDEPP